MSSTSATLPVGDWGGEQVMLSVGPDKAVLRLGCAQGVFAAPVALDASGSFSTSGTLANHGGGPSSPSSPNHLQRVTFEGTLAGNHLTLVVRSGGSAETYQLIRGMQSKVIGCLNPL